MRPHTTRFPDFAFPARACLLGLLTLPLLAGCGGGGGGGSTSSAPTPTPAPTAQSVTATTATGLTATISEPSSTVAVGSAVTYTLTLTNNTANPVPVHATSTPSAPSANVTVTGPTGAITFQPLPGEPPLANGSLAAGQSISTTKTATGFTAAGTYSAVAAFSDDVTASKSVGPLLVTAQ